MALPAGLEPATSGLENRCSIQLSYGSLFKRTSLFAQQQANPIACEGSMCYSLVMIWLRVLILLSLPLLTGCGTVSYYAQAACGQAELICKRQSIEALLADPKQPEALKVRLRLVKELREFAAKELDLNPGDSYTHYVKLDRPMALWVVNATPEFSLELKSWWYPFVGEFEGRGFFDKHQAEHLAKDLHDQGYDVVMSGAPAYSTLGWFADPVLSTFINLNDADLAELIFHELTHQRLYVPDDTAFNESFATATAQAATSKWLTARRDEDAIKLYADSIRRLNRITQMLSNTRDNLRTLYSNPPDDINTLRQNKADIYKELRVELKTLQNEPGFSGVKDWLRGPMNNASLSSVAIYHRHVPAFHNLFESCDHNFSDYIKAVEQLGELPHAERHRELDMLRLSAP